MLLNLAQITFDDNISIGNVITLVFIMAAFALIYFKTRKDVEIAGMSDWIKKHDVDSEKDENRLRTVEDAIVRLIALQETTDRRILSIEKRHERVDAKR